MLGAESLYVRMDRRRDPLIAVDLAPRHLPAAEIARQVGDRVREALQLVLWARVAREPHHDLVARLGLGRIQRLRQPLAPYHRQRLRDRIAAPAVVPAAQHRDRRGEPRSTRIGGGSASYAASKDRVSSAKPGWYLSNAAACSLSRVQPLLPVSICCACRPRKFSPSVSMYLGKRAGSGLKRRQRDTARHWCSGPSRWAGWRRSAIRTARAARASPPQDRCRRPAWCNRSGRRGAERTAGEDKRSPPCRRRTMCCSSCSP